MKFTFILIFNTYSYFGKIKNDVSANMITFANTYNYNINIIDVTMYLY